LFTQASTSPYYFLKTGLAFIGLLVISIFANAKITNLQETESGLLFKSGGELISAWESLETTESQLLAENGKEDWLLSVVHFKNLAAEQKNDSLLLSLNFIHGSLLFSMAKYYQAIPILRRLLDQRARLDEEQLIGVLVSLEESYRRTANLKEAIPIRKERIELGLDQDFFEIYEEAGLYSEAIVEFTQHNAFPNNPLGQLGYHARLGRLYNQNNQLDSAIYHYEHAFSYGFTILENDDYLGKSPHYEFRKKFWTYEMKGEIGTIYAKQGRYKEAIPLLKKIISVGKEINESALVVPKRLVLVACYLKLQDTSLSKSHLDTVKQVTDNMDWFTHKVKYQQVLAEYFYKKGIFDSAAIAYKEHAKLKDSVQSIQNKNKLIATTAFLDNERQGKLLAEQRLELVAFENERIQKSNQLYLLIFILFGALGLAVFLFIDSRRKQKAKEMALEDKTIIEKQSKKIQELDKVKTRFFSNISHEFRTPLTLIQGPIESILQGRAKGEALIKKNLEVATRNVKNLRNLIDEILEFNKMDFGTVDVHYVPVLLSDYFLEFSENYASLVAEKRLTWKLDAEIDASLQLSLPIDKVEKILHNLLSNAIKHAPANTTVSLSVTYLNETLKIAVSDEGAGIPQDEQEKIFERFYQASEGKLMPHSSGIGLAYVKEITEALDGTITIKSESGIGTTFFFALPAEVIGRSSKGEQVEEEVVYEKELPYPYSNNKILLTEDNEEMANYIKQVLGDEFIVEWAENGKEALTKLESFDADLIITDIMMPIMTGLELLEKLKANDRYKYKSVIMLTAKSSQETRLDALSFGLDDYLTKPFNPLELEYRVKNLLRNQYERGLALKDEDSTETIEDPLINELIVEIEKNINNRNFGVLDLSNSAALSDRQLTRITKKSIGLTPANLIREVRLQKAKHYLEAKVYRSVAETCYAVGFEKPSYFSKIYIERSGKKPSSYFS
jgi:signal transduction histidine kinase/DNA-binding response OmpR family regulator